MRHASRGFTIIELLVVIAIIGLLAALTIASFDHIQRRAHDTRRMADVQSITKALASFVATNGGTYPTSVIPVTITGTDAFSTMLVQSGSIAAVPHDPMTGTYDYTYISNANGTDYTITFCLETDTIKGYSPGCSNTIKP